MIRKHYKEKPFPCDRCDKKFFTITDQQKHVKIVHLNEKPFACEKCGKQYSTSGGLLIHNRSAHGDQGEWLQCDQSLDLPTSSGTKAFYKNIKGLIQPYLLVQMINKEDPSIGCQLLGPTLWETLFCFCFLCRIIPAHCSLVSWPFRITEL